MRDTHAEATEASPTTTDDDTSEPQPMTHHKPFEQSSHKYDTTTTTDDLIDAGLRTPTETTRTWTRSHEDGPERNANADYDRLCPPVVNQVFNARAWHPSWGPTPPTMDAVVPLTAATISADTQMTLGETDSGQPIKQSWRAEQAGNYSNTPDGYGATVGRGWNADMPDWQIMERELAGDSLELSGSGVARLEAATAEQELEAQRRAQYPTREQIAEHFAEDRHTVGGAVESDSGAQTLWDEIGEQIADAVEGFEAVATRPISELWADARAFTEEKAAERAQTHRAELAGEQFVTTAVPAYPAYTPDGDRHPMAEQARMDAPDHRPHAERMTTERTAGTIDPEWGAQSPETEERILGGEPTEVAVEPVAPIAVAREDAEAKHARIQTIPADLLAGLEARVISLAEIHDGIHGRSTEETHYADLTADLEAGEPHPANEHTSDRITVAQDGSIERSIDSTSPYDPSIDTLTDALLDALGRTRDEITAPRLAMDAIYHGTDSQPMDQVNPGWIGATIEAVVTQTYTPADPHSMQQVLMLEDIQPSLRGGGQIASNAKATVWALSDQAEILSVGDHVRLANVKPGQYKNQLTFAIVADTDITVVSTGAGETRSYLDCIDMTTGANEGHNPAPTARCTVESADGPIEEPADVTYLHEKRYRRPEETYHVGPPYQDKHSRARRPIEEQPCPMTWIYETTEWIRSNWGTPEETTTVVADEVRENHTHCAVRNDAEPAGLTTDVTPEALTVTLGRLAGKRTAEWRFGTPAADVERIHARKQPDSPTEVAVKVEHHPHAAEPLELVVFSGITPAGEVISDKIYVTEWNTDDAEPVTILKPISRKVGWERKLLNEVVHLRNKAEDPSRPVYEGTDDTGVPVYSL